MTDREPRPDAEVSAFLSRFPAEIAALAKQCLPKLRRAFAGCHELVYDYANSLVVSFSASERGYEGIVTIAISAREVKLYFDKSLPDPKRLLQGSGTKVRSVAINAASDLDHGDIRVLIEAAIKRSGLSLPRTGAARIIIKSKAKKRVRTKPARA